MAHKRIHQNSGQLKKFNSFSYEWIHNMILKDLKIFSQNVWKNNFLINTLLEVNKSFDIIFIQEPLWTTLRTIPSSTNCEGIPLVGIPNHPNWLTFAREPCSSNDPPRVIIYINVRLSSFHFSLWKDIINHKDILLASFFGLWTFILTPLILP